MLRSKGEADLFPPIPRWGGSDGQSAPPWGLPHTHINSPHPISSKDTKTISLLTIPSFSPIQNMDLLHGTIRIDKSTVWITANELFSAPAFPSSVTHIQHLKHLLKNILALHLKYHFVAAFLVKCILFRT